MAWFSHFSTSAAVQVRKLCGTSAALLACFSFSPSSALVEASPVTFSFQGQVVATDTVGSPSFNLPESIRVGANAELRITFEPIAFPHAAITNGPFTSPGGHANIYPVEVLLELGSTSLADQLASLFVEHDPLGPATPESPAEILLQEQIAVRSEGLSAELPGVEWHTDGGFANYGSVLSGGDDLSDSAVWNSLPIRSVTTTFRKPGELASILVTAQFGNGVQAPEPTTSSCIILIVAAIALRKCLLRCRR